MRGGGDHVGVGHGVGVQPGGDQAGEVCHVDQEVGVDTVGDLPELGEVELTWVGGPAGHDHLRPVLLGECGDLVVVDGAVLVTHVVGHGVEGLAGVVEPHAVGQVPAVGQVHAEDGVARLEQGEVHRGVGLGARVGLHVDVFGAEQLLGAVDRQLLDDVDVFATTVVTTARVPFRVLVGQDGALSLQNGLGREVLRGDHLESVALAGQLGIHGGRNLGIQLAQGLVECVVGGHRGLTPRLRSASCIPRRKAGRWVPRRLGPGTANRPRRGRS